MSEEERPEWEGFVERECGDHRTVGSHRAWCFDCHEWCYPKTPCKGCEIPLLRTQLDLVVSVVRWMAEHGCTANQVAHALERILAGGTPKVWSGTEWIDFSLRDNG